MELILCLRGMDLMSPRMELRTKRLRLWHPYKQMFDDLRRKDPELYPPPLYSSFSSFL
uniref:Uncharacterized protein n=1 Tax=Salix viminalis TaxID=40686 RepID=A0A6N2MU70_SALVM